MKLCHSPSSTYPLQQYNDKVNKITKMLFVCVYRDDVCLSPISVVKFTHICLFVSLAKGPCLVLMMENKVGYINFERPRCGVLLLKEYVHTFRTWVTRITLVIIRNIRFTYIWKPLKYNFRSVYIPVDKGLEIDRNI